MTHNVLMGMLNPIPTHSLTVHTVAVSSVCISQLSLLYIPFLALGQIALQKSSRVTFSEVIKCSKQFEKNVILHSIWLYLGKMEMIYDTDKIIL